MPRTKFRFDEWLERKAYFYGLKIRTLMPRKWAIGLTVSLTVIVSITMLAIVGSVLENLNNKVYIDYFSSNKEKVLIEVNNLLLEKSYEEAREMAEKYLGTNDKELIGLYEKAKNLEQQRIAKFGKLPDKFDALFIVEQYLKAAKDPDRIKIDNCTKAALDPGGKGWLTACEWRGKNSFGAYVRESSMFIIQHNHVVEVSSL